MKKIFVLGVFILLFIASGNVCAQQYTGMNGLLHVPSAEMDSAGSTHVGGHALPKYMMPDRMQFEGKKYASSNWYLSATPLKWLEVGYSFTLMKFHKNKKKNEKVGFYSKDRYFSVRIQPLYEGRYWPAVVIGGNDVWGQRDGDSKSFYFQNFYVAATKHFDLSVGEAGVHLAYRKWRKSFNKRWNGPVGGLTFRPSFYPPLRLITEYDGDGVNLGADCLLLKYIQLQASLMDCKYLSAGAGVRIPLKPLLSKKKKATSPSPTPSESR